VIMMTMTTMMTMTFMTMMTVTISIHAVDDYDNDT
jgi:hypothetical protein